ncbi:MAG: type 1 glutamine amidotransferase [Nitratireductor sp.]
MRLLIVDGNSAEILAANERSGRKPAWKSFAESLLLHEAGADISIGYPYDKARETAAIDPDNFDGIALTGSAVAWGAESPEARAYLDYIEPLVASGKPVLGSCWGMQTVSVLLGGMCGPNPNGSEIGLSRHIRLTHEGRQHPLFAGMAEQFASPTWHRDIVLRKPDGAVLLAESEITPIQSIAFCGNGVDYMGYQFHPECDLEDFKAGFKARTPLPGTISETIDFPDDPPSEVANPGERTRTIGNWLAHVRGRMAA